MPPKPRKTNRNLVEQEGRIRCAIQYLKDQKIQKIAEAARIYNIPYQTLRGRLKGQQFQAELRNHQHRLSFQQKDVLIAWIVLLDIRGAPPGPVMYAKWHR